MASRHQQLRSLLTSAIVDLCRKEAFYFQELRIEGTVCLVSDRSSVLITQLTEQIGEQQNVDEQTEKERQLPVLNSDQAKEGFRKRQASTDSVKRDSEDAEGKKRRVDEDSDDATECGDEPNSTLGEPKAYGASTSPESLFRCTLCPKVFPSLDHLQKHMCVHAAHRPYKCHQCEASFGDFESLCTHINDDHSAMSTPQPEKEAKRDEEAVYCTICHQKCEGEAGVIEHYVTSHNRTGILPSNIHALYTREPPTPEATPPTPTGPPRGKVIGSALVKEEPVDGGETACQEQNRINGQQQQQQPHMIAPNGEPGAEGVTNIMQNFMRMIESQQQPNMHPGQLEHARQMAANEVARMQAHPNAMFPRWNGDQSLPPVSAAFPTTSMQSPAQPDNTMTGAHSLRRPADVNVEYQRSPSGKFQCPYCEKTYSFKHTLKDHINKHTGSRPHICKHCGDSFTHLASLCAHIKRRHDNYMPNDYKCDICQEKFMNLQSLKQHFTWRHREVKFDIMGPTASIPVEKEVVPDNEKPPMDANQMNAMNQSGPPVSLPNWENMNNYIAQNQLSFEAMANYNLGNSDSSMSQSSHLAGTPGMAMDDSGGNSRMSQEIKSPYTEDNLEETPPGLIIAEYFTEMNLQTDNGVYKYKCKLCGNMFKFRGSLYEHVNTHLGKRPYVCTLCGDAFAHHSSLHNHTRNKHSAQSPAEKEATLKHPCPVCPKKFRFRSELERHFRSNPEHNINNAPLPVDTNMENEAPEVVPEMLIGPNQVPYPMQHQV